MARKPQVTRTLHSYIATVLCIDIDKKETFYIEKTVARKKSEREILGLTQAELTPKKKAVSVISIKEEISIYGMLEDDFIKVAKKIEKRTNDIK